MICSPAHRLVAFGACLLTLVSSAAFAQTTGSTVPTLIPVSGVMTTPSGAPRTGAVLLVISLYDEKDAPAPMWIEHQNVTLGPDGSYRVYAGGSFPDGLPSYLFGSTGARFVGVAVENEPEQPREMLIASAYAAHAVSADTIAGKSLSDLVLSENLSSDLKTVLVTPEFRDLMNSTKGGPSTLATTVNCIPKFTTSGGAIDDSTICQSPAGNIGIGLLNPAVKLTVSDPTNVPRNTLGTASGGLSLVSSNTITGLFLGASGTTGNSWIQAGRNDGVAIPYNLSLNAAGGNVGIGTITPAVKLTVVDPANVTGMTPGTPAGGLSVVSSNTITGLFLGASGLTGNSWIQAGRNDGVAIPYNLSLNGAGGNVGIGIVNPPVKLTVLDPANVTAMTLGTPSGGLSLMSNNTITGLFFGASGATGNSWIQAGRNDGVPIPYNLSLNSSGGNVGVGTANPTSKFHVAGDAKVDGNMTVDGNIGAKYQDVAEWVDAAEPLEPGTIVSIDATGKNVVMATRRAYDSGVAGAVSRQPGLVLGLPGEPGENRVLVAQSGRVRIKVDATYGAIRPGDLLVSSPRGGYAMRSKPVRVGGVTMHRPGTVIGKALEPLASGDGEILALLTLQ